MTDVNELVRQAAGMLQFKAAEKGQHITTSLPAAHQYVYCFKEKLIRVLGNLVTNAIKFSPKGSQITIGVSADESSVQIAVADNGIGIPEGLRAKLFEPFTTAKRYGTEGEKAFGLGLSICKKIVEDAGGRIWFESEEGKGSTFLYSCRYHSKQQLSADK